MFQCRHSCTYFQRIAAFPLWPQCPFKLPAFNSNDIINKTVLKLYKQHKCSCLRSILFIPSAERYTINTIYFIANNSILTVIVCKHKKQEISRTQHTIGQQWIRKKKILRVHVNRGEKKEVKTYLAERSLSLFTRKQTHEKRSKKMYTKHRERTGQNNKIYSSS